MQCPAQAPGRDNDPRACASPHVKFALDIPPVDEDENENEHHIFAGEGRSHAVESTRGRRQEVGRWFKGDYVDEGDTAEAQEEDALAVGGGGANSHSL